MFRLPAIYKKAFWHNTTAVDQDESALGVGFCLGASGQLVRLRLSKPDARQLAESIMEMLDPASEAAASRQDPPGSQQ